MRWLKYTESYWSYKVATQSFSYSINHKTLNDIKILINTPSLVSVKELDGMFWRGEDFSQSYANLTQQYMGEFKLANVAFPNSKSTDELHTYVANDTRPSSTGDDHFTTYTLSPYLRHFLNDTCRLLEPTTSHFARKHPELKFVEKKSLNSYISDLHKNQTLLPFDSHFIAELYELWNDYKHRTTKGLHATPWRYISLQVIEPKLGLSEIGYRFKKLDKLTIDEFVKETNETILAYLKYTYSEVLNEHIS